MKKIILLFFVLVISLSFVLAQWEDREYCELSNRYYYTNYTNISYAMEMCKAECPCYSDGITINLDKCTEQYYWSIYEPWGVQCGPCENYTSYWINYMTACQNLPTGLRTFWNSTPGYKMIYFDNGLNWILETDWFNQYCGDGIVQGNEECDDMFNNGMSGYCNLNCSGMMDMFCGDGNCDEDYGENCSTCPEDCGECKKEKEGNGGGGGGGGGGRSGGFLYTPPETNLISEPEAEEKPGEILIEKIPETKDGFMGFVEKGWLLINLIVVSFLVLILILIIINKR